MKNTSILKVFFILCSLTLCKSALPAEPSKDSISRIDHYLNRAAQNGYSGSVLLAENGRILLQKGYGFADSEKKIPFAADTVFDIGSITKQFTAACILKLETQGKLSTSDPITRYFDSVPDDKKGITLHQLLTHTAGLTDSLGADEEWIGREEYIKTALNSKLLHPPGSYSYSNVGYSLLAAIVEKVSAGDYEKFLSDQLLKPAGMKQTGYVIPKWDKSKMAIGYMNGKRWGTTFDQSNYAKGVTWHLKGNGGIHSTVGDLYLWTRALRGNAVLSEAAKQKYFAPHVKSSEQESYGYGWSVFQNDRKETVIAHNGGNGSFMATLGMIPQKDFAIVVSTNRFPKNTDSIARRIDKLLYENLEELPDTFVKGYSGVYVLPSGNSFPVSFNENDEAVVLLNETETWHLFGGSESDDPQRIKNFNQKSSDLMASLLANDIAKAASISGVEANAFQAEVQDFRKQIENENGKWSDSEIIGTVERRNGEYHLTAVRFKCETDNPVKLLIWHENMLSGFRDLPEGNTKNFEHKKSNEFYAESNDRTIFFDNENNKPILRIKTSSGEIKARKK